MIGSDNNNKSSITTDLDVGYDVVVKTPNILSCSEQRAFWISWQDDILRVGEGAVIGEKKFMEHKPSKPHPVRSVKFDTNRAANAHWEIFNSKG